MEHGNLRPLAEFIADKCRNAIDDRVVKVDEKEYFVRGKSLIDTTHDLKLSEVVHPPVIGAQTLQAIPDYFGGGFDKDGAFVLVSSPFAVDVMRSAHQIDGERDLFLASRYRAAGDHFDEWMAVEAFVVWLLSGFVPNEHSALLQAALGAGVKIEAVRQVSDDGVSQQLKRSHGVTGAEWAMTLPPHLKLKPRRTFPEVEQPEVLCTFRVRNNDDDEPIQVRLIESDGGAWRHVAMASIGEWLRDRLGKEVPILS